MKQRILLIIILLIPVLLKFIPIDKATNEQKCIEVKKSYVPIYSEVMQEIKRREGLRLIKYKCPAGVETNGYGFTGNIPDTMTVLQAIDSLHSIFEKHYKLAQKEFPELQRNQHLAISMLTYNIGWARFKSYRLYKKIKSGQPIYSDWYQIRFYKNTSGKTIESENLKAARLFELCLWQEDYSKIKNI